MNFDSSHSTLSRVSLSHFVEQLNSTVEDAVSDPDYTLPTQPLGNGSRAGACVGERGKLGRHKKMPIPFLVFCPWRFYRPYSIGLPVGPWCHMPAEDTEHWSIAWPRSLGPLVGCSRLADQAVFLRSVSVDEEFLVGRFDCFVAGGFCDSCCLRNSLL